MESLISELFLPSVGSSSQEDDLMDLKKFGKLDLQAASSVANPTMRFRAKKHEEMKRTRAEAKADIEAKL